MLQLKQIFDSIFLQFSIMVPKILGSIILLLVGWAIAKVVASVVEKILIGIKADRLADKINEIDIFQKANFDIKISSLLPKVLYYFILLTFIIAATDFLGLTIISQQITDILEFIPKAIAAAIVFLVGVIFANFVRNAINTTFRSLGIPSGKLISSFIFYFLLITISITALSQTGMDTLFLTQNIQIILGGIIVAFAVGFGFASRPVLNNILAAGYTKQKFMIGMHIQVGTYEGMIVDIDNTALTLQLANERRVIIPQSDIISSKVEVLDSKLPL